MQTATKEHPMLFSGEMVRALLDGKTQTRRPITKLKGYRQNTAFQPSIKRGYDFDVYGQDAWHHYRRDEFLKLLPYQVGDQIWVRESGLENKNARLFIHDAAPGKYWSAEDGGRYGASCNTTAITREYILKSGKWKVRPSIHMPRWASRLTLEITGVRIERIQDISEGDALAEGVEYLACPQCGHMDRISLGATLTTRCPARDCGLDYLSAIEGFKELWESTYPGSWDRNDHVIVLDFRRVENG